jgi:hypothetical protein
MWFSRIQVRWCRSSYSQRGGDGRVGSGTVCAILDWDCITPIRALLKPGLKAGLGPENSFQVALESSPGYLERNKHILRISTICGRDLDTLELHLSVTVSTGRPSSTIRLVISIYLSRCRGQSCRFSRCCGITMPQRSRRQYALCPVIIGPASAPARMD